MQIPSFTIHDFPTGPHPARVRIALAEKGLVSHARFVKVSLLKGEHKREAFLAKNPTGKVPVLELDDGTFIAECTAITEYLDNLDGHPVLTGTTPREKAMIHMMQRRAEADLADAIDLYFHNATPGLGPHVEVYQNPEWGNRQRDKALAGMAYFDGILRSRPYVAGDTFSMADITVIAGLLFADIVKLAIPADCTALAAWNAAMAERPSVKNRVAMSKPV